MTDETPVLDLTHEAVPAETASSTIDPREPARRFIALILLFMLGAIVAGTLVVVFMPGTVELQRAKDLLGLVFSPIVGLVGSVVGFYFGAQTVQEAKKGLAYT